MRLIDADALKEAIKELPNDNPSYYYTGYLLDRECVLDEIDNAPTVEQVDDTELQRAVGYAEGYEKGKNERPKGKAIIRTNGDMSNYYICSECHKPVDGWDKFCRDCGADLGGINK